VKPTRLNVPEPIAVVAGDDGRPSRVTPVGRRRAVAVEQVLDEWQIDDRWWTDTPIRRRYFSCQTANGAIVTVFCDDAGGWFAHRN
jgi:hypothetical protein